MADITHMECCGAKEISELSEMTLSKAGVTKFLRNIKEILTDEGHFAEHYDYARSEYTKGPWVDEVVHTPAFFIFTQAGTSTDPAGRHPYGTYFKSFIESEGLGTVLQTDPAMNENSGNLVTVFLWTVCQSAFKAWGTPKKVTAA